MGGCDQSISIHVEKYTLFCTLSALEIHSTLALSSDLAIKGGLGKVVSAGANTWSDIGKI